MDSLVPPKGESGVRGRPIRADCIVVCVIAGGKPCRFRETTSKAKTNENGRFGRLTLRKGLEKQVGDGGLSRIM